MPPRAMPQVVTGTPEGVSLEALLVRAAAGDQGSFRLLYERTSGRLFAICLRIARERSLAEDFLQEAYARIWERSRQFDAARGSALAWMIAITRNHAIDVIRVRQREVALPDESALEIADPKSGEAETRLDYGAACRCLASLEEGPRRAILLAYRDGLSYKELAVVLGAPIGTVKTWVHRGIASLRNRLDERP